MPEMCLSFLSRRIAFPSRMEGVQCSHLATKGLFCLLEAWLALEQPCFEHREPKCLPAFRAESSTPAPRHQGPSWALQATEHHLWPLFPRCQQHPSSYDHQ